MKKKTKIIDIGDDDEKEEDDVREDSLVKDDSINDDVMKDDYIVEYTGKKENWKNIKGYDGRYQISDCGNVMDLKKNQILKQCKRAGGDLRVNLYKNGKERKFAVHHLVASHFINNPNKRNIVLHTDRNKMNNNVINLEWSLHSKFNGKNNKNNNNIAIEDQYKLKERYTIKKKDIPTVFIEQIKDMIGYKDLYKISNAGDIFSKTGKKRKQIIVGGYYTIGLIDMNHNRKTIQVHLLVAQHFIKNDDPENNIKIDHIDNNKLNNRVDNLRWFTQSDNIHSYNVNYKKQKFKKILQYDLEDNFIKEWISIFEIIETHPEYCKNSIYSVCTLGKNVYGYKWKYESDEEIVKLEDDEIFKNIGIHKEHYFSRYECSNYAKIRRIDSKKILKPNTGGDYDSIMIYDDEGKSYRFSIHVLVASVFIRKIKDNDIVNHIDENKRNNILSNLEIITYKQNAEHSFAKAVFMIDIDTNNVIKEFKSIVTACEYLNKHINYVGHISNCCNNKQKTAIGYKWKFKD